MGIGLCIESLDGDKAAERLPHLPIARIGLSRRLHGPLQARVDLLSQDPDDGRDLRSTLAATLAAGNITGQLVDADAAHLTPVGRVVGSNWDSHTYAATIDLQFTAARQPGKREDPHVPRWRVLHPRGMGDVAREFSSAAEISRAVAVILQNRLSFGDTDIPIIQSGMSDWDMLEETMRQSARCPEGIPVWWPLTRYGGWGDASRPGWMIESASTAFHRDFGDLQNRTLDAGALAGAYRAIFSRIAAPVGGPRRLHSVLSTGHYWAGRDFEKQAWLQWIDRPLPMFLHDPELIVWQVTDWLYRTGRADRVSWDTRVEVLRYDDLCEVYGYLGRPHPWFGRGIVAESSEYGPTIQVKLPGFESQRHGDTLTAVLTTPYAGSPATRGLHFVPEQDTEITLSWSGVFGEPAFVMGNLRTRETELPSPSTWLDRESHIRLASVDAQELGTIRAGSDVVVEGQEGIRLASQGPLVLEGNDGKAVLKQGQFRTGRG